MRSRRKRLAAEIEAELGEAEAASLAAEGAPARRFRDFLWSTLKSWSQQRRVVAKAEWTRGGANARFVVTSLTAEELAARPLYEERYCARGEMENRIKECQLDLFSDRTSTHSLRANQLRLWFASLAYVLCADLRPAPHRPARHRPGPGHMWQHSPQAAENRCLREDLQTPDQDRHGFGLSSPEPLGARPSTAIGCRGLKADCRSPSPSTAQEKRRTGSSAQVRCPSARPSKHARHEIRQKTL